MQSKPALLWIEDQPGFLTKARRELEDHFEFRLAADAPAGLEELQQRDFLVLIIDAQIPLGRLAEDPVLGGHFTQDAELAGLGFVRLTSTDHLESLGRAPPKVIAICSGHHISYLQATSSLDFSKLNTFTKGAVRMQPVEFSREILRLAGTEGGPRITETSGNRPVLHPVEKKWHDIAHDVKNELEQGLNILATAYQMVANDSKAAVGTPDAESRLGPAASALLDELSAALDRLPEKMYGTDRYSALETQLEVLKNALAQPSVAKRAMFANSARTVRRLLPSVMPQEASVARLCRDLELVLALSDMSNVSHFMTHAIEMLESPPTYQQNERVDALEVFRIVAKRLERTAAARRLEIKGETSGSAVILGDATLLDRAFANLIGNAIKYNGQLHGSNAWVTLGRKIGPEFVEISVESWGRHIPETEHQLILRSGLRGERASRPGEGLGLSIANEAINSMQGSLRIRSDPPDSRTPNRYVVTVFTVVLPIARDPSSE
jgi:signal transduction histidine kinase